MFMKLMATRGRNNVGARSRIPAEVLILENVKADRTGPRRLRRSRWCKGSTRRGFRTK